MITREFGGSVMGVSGRRMGLGRGYDGETELMILWLKILWSERMVLFANERIQKVDRYVGCMCGSIKDCIRCENVILACRQWWKIVITLHMTWSVNAGLTYQILLYPLCWWALDNLLFSFYKPRDVCVCLDRLLFIIMERVSVYCYGFFTPMKIIETWDVDVFILIFILLSSCYTCIMYSVI